MTGAVADRSRQWVHRYVVRRGVRRDVYYALRFASGTETGPAALVERDQTDPDHEAGPWNRVDPPAPREGRTELLDDWTAGELRRAGLALAPRVVVLKREQLDGRDPRPDSIGVFLFGVFGFSALFCGLLFWWSAARAERRLVVR